MTPGETHRPWASRPELLWSRHPATIISYSFIKNDLIDPDTHWSIEFVGYGTPTTARVTAEADVAAAGKPCAGAGGRWMWGTTGAKLGSKQPYASRDKELQAS
jgi:hypothetical protein